MNFSVAQSATLPSPGQHKHLQRSVGSADCPREKHDNKQQQRKWITHIEHLSIGDNRMTNMVPIRSREDSNVEKHYISYHLHSRRHRIG